MCLSMARLVQVFHDRHVRNWVHASTHPEGWDGEGERFEILHPLQVLAKFTEPSLATGKLLKEKCLLSNDAMLGKMLKIA